MIHEKSVRLVIWIWIRIRILRLVTGLEASVESRRVLAPRLLRRTRPALLGRLVVGTRNLRLPSGNAERSMPQEREMLEAVPLTRPGWAASTGISHTPRPFSTSWGSRGRSTAQTTGGIWLTPRTLQRCPVVRYIHARDRVELTVAAPGAYSRCHITLRLDLRGASDWSQFVR